MKKNKGTIFCIHGNSSSSNIFKDLLIDENINYSVLAVDLPGHGQNQDWHKEEDFSLDAYRQFLLDEINAIDDDILLFGNSLGGHLAIEVAPEIKRLKGLVIMGTPLKKPLNFEEAFLPTDALNTFLDENPKEDEIKKSAEIAVYHKRHSLKVIEYFEQANPRVRKLLSQDMTNGKWKNQKDIFVNLDVTKFIIHGMQDPAVSFKYLQEMKIACDNCDVFTIENCGHYPSLEQPKEFSRIMNLISKSVFSS